MFWEQFKTKHKEVADDDSIESIRIVNVRLTRLDSCAIFWHHGGPDRAGAGGGGGGCLQRRSSEGNNNNHNFTHSPS